MKSLPQVDGRVARGERNTEAIVRALLRLYARGRYSPTVGEVANLAGVTRRSIYNRFPDIESVAEELAGRQLQEHAELYRQVPDPSLPMAERVAEFAEQTAQLFEAIGPVRRAALVNAHRSAAIRRHVRRMQAKNAERVSRAFQEDLLALERQQRDRVLHALVVGSSFDAWDRLRTVQKLPVQGAQEVLECLLNSMLSQASERRGAKRVSESGRVQVAR